MRNVTWETGGTNRDEVKHLCEAIQKEFPSFQYWYCVNWNESRPLLSMKFGGLVQDIDFQWMPKHQLIITVTDFVEYCLKNSQSLRLYNHLRGLYDK